MTIEARTGKRSGVIYMYDMKGLVISLQLLKDVTG